MIFCLLITQVLTEAVYLLKFPSEAENKELFWLWTILFFKVGNMVLILKEYNIHESTLSYKSKNLWDLNNVTSWFENIWINIGDNFFYIKIIHTQQEIKLS